jgi:cation transport ATPase
MSGATAELELIVAELDCADEAAQIESALGRLPAVTGVRTSVAAHKVLVRYDPSGIGPDDLRAAIAGLGMTVRAGGEPVVARSAGLAERLGALFVTAVALVALVGILGEWLGLFEGVTTPVPAWLTISAVLLGGFPIFRNVLRALRNRTVTSHALMTIGIVGALAIGQIDGLCASTFYHLSPTLSLSEQLRISPKWSNADMTGGSTFMAHVLQAALAIEAGLCSRVLILYGSAARRRATSTD